MKIKKISLSYGFLINVFWLALLLGYLFLSQFAPGRETVYSTHAFMLLFVSLVLLVSARAISNKLLLIPKFPIIVYLYFSILPFLIIATVFGLDYKGVSELGGGLNNLIYQVIFIMFLGYYVLVNKVDREGMAVGFAYLFIAYSFISTFFAIQLFLTGSILSGPFLIESNRWPQLYGWFQSPNFYVNAIALSFFGAIYLYLKKGFSFMRLLSVIFFGLAIVLSGSKGGMLVAFFAVLLFYYLSLFVHPSAKQLVIFLKVHLALVFSIFLGLLTLIFYLNSLGLNIEWLTRSVIRIQSAGDGTGRLDLWSNSLAILLDANIWQLLFGHGNNYIIATYGASTHNGHLKMIVENGIVSYVVLWFLFLFAMYRVIKISSSSRSLAFLLFTSLFYVWFRPLFNAGLFSAGILGFTFIWILFMVSLKEKKAKI